jgi:hypothetical protein
MQDNKTQSGWLTALGREELHLAKTLGWDHPEVLEAQHRFRDAYNCVKSLRNTYELPSAEKTDG